MTTTPAPEPAATDALLVPADAPTGPTGHDPRTRLLVALAASTTLVLWASAFVSIRDLGDSVSPGALALGRLLVAAVALGLLLMGRPKRWPGRRDVPLLLVCGTMWFGVYNLALNDAERRIDAGTAALVVQVGPIVVALLATVFLGELLHRWLVVGMVVGFAGVLVIARASSQSSEADLLGVGLAVVAALTYAVGVLAQKPLVSRTGPLEVTFLACLVGAVVCLPWAGDLVGTVREGDASVLLQIAYLGIFPTAIAFTTWAYALTRSDAGTLALTTFLVPLIATLLAWLLLDEVPPALAFVGGLLCIAGVALTRLRPKAARG